MAGRRRRAHAKTARGGRRRGAADLGAVGKQFKTRAFRAALQAVVDTLDEIARPSAVIGGLAVIAHGFARSTADIDAAIVLENGEVRELLLVARAHGLLPRIPDAEVFAHRNMVLLLEHHDTSVPVDLSLATQPFELEALREAETVDFAGVRIRIPSRTAMVIYKMIAARPQDLSDAAALLAGGAVDESRIATLLREFDQILDSDKAAEFGRLMAASRR
jgi:hypothetical protein